MFITSGHPCFWLASRFANMNPLAQQGPRQPVIFSAGLARLKIVEAAELGIQVMEHTICKYHKVRLDYIHRIVEALGKGKWRGSNRSNDSLS